MKRKEVGLALFLILTGIFFRTIWHIGPNVEFLTTASFLSSYYLSKKWAIIVPLATIVASDIVLGNTLIFLFTWSGYVGIGLLASLVKNIRRVVPIVSGLGFVIVSALWFYLWTNFGVWLLDSFGMYDNTLSGLINSYIAGFPFLRAHIIGSIMFLTLSFGVIYTYQFFISRVSYQRNSRIRFQSS
ncbi:hypothetical protein HYW55_06230 [Candidatus Gottesmanbacteria bacterium]|nr:hypothetical protein [Candidatus Gottesmanbacteria bacterium]